MDNAVFWPLSTAEAFAVNQDLRIVDPEHPSWASSYWWLRSPGYSDHDAATVNGDGSVVYSGNAISSWWCVRPAFNLNSSSVLFTSAAVGGKPDGGLTPISKYTGNEWKLTLKDSNRNFAVTETTVSGDPGDTVTLHYTGATIGDNEYISVILAAESGVQYYGRIAKATTAEGEISLTIPDTLAEGTYTLNVFNEQCNGDYKTDYASAFAEVALTVEEAAAPGIDTGKAIQLVDSGTVANISGGQADNIYFGTYQQSSDGNSGYNIDPIKWRVLENADESCSCFPIKILMCFSITWTMRA